MPKWRNVSRLCWQVQQQQQQQQNYCDTKALDAYVIVIPVVAFLDIVVWVVKLIIIRSVVIVGDYHYSYLC